MEDEADGESSSNSDVPLSQLTNLENKIIVKHFRRWLLQQGVKENIQ